MLYTLFFIVKVIGILLLSIIGLLLSLLAVVLLVPIRYKSAGSYYKTPLAEFSISWLFAILSIKIKIAGSNRTFSFQLFGRDFPKKKKRKKKKAKRDTETITTKETPKTSEETVQVPDKRPAAENQKEQGSASNDSLIRKIFIKLKYTFFKICDRLKAIRKSLISFTEFFNKEENKKTISLIKKELFVILKHIKPKKLRLKMRFGFEDPSYTGMFLGCLAVAKPLYQNNIQLIPDFENSVVEGEYTIKGRIYGIILLYVFIRLFLDKNLRRLVKQFMG